jgi:Ca2+-binding EF-hand superfamily protein
MSAAVRLQGLKYPLQHLNGVDVAEPVLVDPLLNRFLVTTLDPEKVGVQIVVGLDNLKYRQSPEVRAAAAEAAKTEKALADGEKATKKKLRSAGIQITRRTNANDALESLASRLRAELKPSAHAQEADRRKNLKRAGDLSRISQLKRAFLAMDTNGDKELNKDEFIAGCDVLGVKLSAADIELIWGYFDCDDSGTLDFEEFRSFIEARGLKGHERQAVVPIQRVKGIRTTKDMRKRRIQHKTDYARVQRELVQETKKALTAYCRTNHKTVKDLFEMFDANGGGDIDKGEFQKGIALINIYPNEQQLNILFQKCCSFQSADAAKSDTIDRETWFKFMCTENANSYLLTSDRSLDALGFKSELTKIGALQVGAPSPVATKVTTGRARKQLAKAHGGHSKRGSSLHAVGHTSSKSQKLPVLYLQNTLSRRRSSLYREIVFCRNEGRGGHPSATKAATAIASLGGSPILPRQMLGARSGDTTSAASSGGAKRERVQRVCYAYSLTTSLPSPSVHSSPLPSLGTRMAKAK